MCDNLREATADYRPRVALNSAWGHEDIDPEFKRLVNASRHFR